MSQLLLSLSADKQKNDLLSVEYQDGIHAVLPFKEETSQYFFNDAGQKDDATGEIISEGRRLNNGVVIICYDCKSSSETCFGVWGTGNCKALNCDEGCCCYD